MKVRSEYDVFNDPTVEDFLDFGSITVSEAALQSPVGVMRAHVECRTPGVTPDEELHPYWVVGSIWHHVY